MEEYCEVLIQNNQNKPKGEIIGLNETILFDPTTILAELRFTPDLLPFEYPYNSRKSVSPKPPNHISLPGISDDEFNHAFDKIYNIISKNEYKYNKNYLPQKSDNPKYELLPFDDFDYDCEWGFGKCIMLKDTERETYYKLISVVRTLIADSYYNQQLIDISRLEILHSFFDISCRFTPSNLYRGKELTVHCSHYSPEYAYSCDPTLFNSYFYECFSLADVVFSILHFLTLGKYKFSKCPHCGQYFATTNYKQKYCSRNSPYLDFEHLTCEQAVRNITQKIRRTRNTIAKNLDENYHFKYEEFLKKSGDLLDEVLKSPTCENITKAFEYIDKDKHYLRKKLHRK